MVLNTPVRNYATLTVRGGRFEERRCYPTFAPRAGAIVLFFIDSCGIEKLLDFAFGGAGGFFNADLFYRIDPSVF